MQVTSTLVFSATKLVPDLTGTSVLAAKSPKLRTPPSNTGKIKGLLKTPNSVNKRRSVCFVDHRNETAYLASNSNDADFIPGIVRVKTPQPKFDAKSPEQAVVAKGKGKAAPSPVKRVEAGKRNERGAETPSAQNPRDSKRRRVEPQTYAGVTISHKIAKDGTSASYVQLSDDSPGLEDIEAYFLDAANRMFADLLSGSTPDKHLAGSKWASYPSGNFPKASSGKKAGSASSSEPNAAGGEWVERAEDLTQNAPQG